MKLITIATVDVDNNTQGMALVQIVISDDGATKVLMNGVDVDNAKGLMEFIGSVGGGMGGVD